MYYTKITIPKMSDTYKLYIYRSKSADDINTISKIMALSPIAIIDESTASFKMISGRKCYEIYDKSISINNELINKEYINTAPIKKARKIIIEDLINNNDIAKYYKGFNHGA